MNSWKISGYRILKLFVVVCFYTFEPIYAYSSKEFNVRECEKHDVLYTQ